MVASSFLCRLQAAFFQAVSQHCQWDLLPAGDVGPAFLSPFNDSQLETQQGDLQILLIAAHPFGRYEIHQAGQEVHHDRVEHRHLAPSVAMEEQGP